MKPQDITSPWARLALALLCAMWTVSGWWVITAGSFSTRPIRSTVVSTADGPAATFMGAVFVVLGVIALLVLLQSLSVSATFQRWAVVALIAIPAALALLG